MAEHSLELSFQYRDFRLRVEVTFEEKDEIICWKNRYQMCDLEGSNRLDVWSFPPSKIKSEYVTKSWCYKHILEQWSSAMLKKLLWLDAAIHGTSFNQLKC